MKWLQTWWKSRKLILEMQWQSLWGWKRRFRHYSPAARRQALETKSLLPFGETRKPGDEPRPPSQTHDP